jgi:predicted nucleic acid-binding protein
MIVDSCILIDVSRGNQAALNFLLHQNERPAISMLTVVEVMRGVRKPSEETLFGALFEKMVCVPVDLDISLRAGDYLRRYGPSHGVDLVDAVIASTAVSMQKPLATLNLKHFPMFPDLARPY